VQRTDKRALLVVIADCPFSGSWVKWGKQDVRICATAAQYDSSNLLVAIQSSCAADQISTQSLFTQAWLRDMYYPLVSFYRAPERWVVFSFVQPASLQLDAMRELFGLLTRNQQQLPDCCVFDGKKQGYTGERDADPRLAKWRWCESAALPLVRVCAPCHQCWLRSALLFNNAVLVVVGSTFCSWRG
jgi:hypothetical protein